MAELKQITVPVRAAEAFTGRRGPRTTEFWLSLVFAAASGVGGPAAGYTAEGLVASALIVAAYSAGRSYEKAQRAKAAAEAVRESLRQ